MTVQPDITLPEGFPDLFIFTLRDILRTNLAADPNFAAASFITRPVWIDDPNRTIAVVEGPANPETYEIAGRTGPSTMQYQAIVQVFVKAASEVEGRNLRRRLLLRVRKTLFLPGTVSALSTLTDGYERATRFKLEKIDFAAVQTKGNGGQFYLLGQIELTFYTELL